MLASYENLHPMLFLYDQSLFLSSYILFIIYFLCGFFSKGESEDGWIFFYFVTGGSFSNNLGVMREDKQIGLASIEHEILVIDSDSIRFVGVLFFGWCFRGGRAEEGPLEKSVGSSEHWGVDL